MMGLLINPFVAFPAFSPASIPDLVGWYDASALPPQTDGTAITPTWTDRVGNVGTIAGAGPTYNTNVQNGLPGAYFGAGQGLNSLVGTSGANDLTYILAVKITDTTTGGFRDILQGNDTTWLITAANGFWEHYHSGTAHIIGSAINSGAGTRILGITQDAGVLTTFYENGVSQGTLVPILDPGPMGFGQTVFAEPFLGWLLEICMYDRVLTAGEMTAVNDYLSAKWAI